MSRDKFAQLAQQTLDIVRNGHYVNSNGEKVIIEGDVNNSKKNTVLYDKDGNVPITSKERFQTKVEVVNASTLAASKALVEEGFENVVALNFASAKNPGGGFLKGSSAQEESLARSSALYETIHEQTKMYEFNKRCGTGLYSDFMIYSDKVPVFRDDNGNLLDKHHTISFITSPAVNRGVVNERESVENKMKVRKTMKDRINKILRVGIERGNDAIVLGAFGCGVFKNDPHEVAALFKENLLYDHELKGKYKKIVFAIYKDDKTFRTFKEILKGL